MLVVGWMAPAGFAQDTKSARGTVTAIAADSLTVKAGESEMRFTVDPKTVLVASGAGTADRKAEAAGKPGPRLTDFVKAGDNVEVSYTATGTAMRATRVQRMSSAGTSGSSGPSTAAPSSMTSNGSVTSISGATLTISGSSGGGGTFTQSYTVNRETNVIARSVRAPPPRPRVAVSPSPRSRASRCPWRYS